MVYKYGRFFSSMSLIYISKVIHPQDMSNLHEYTEQFVSMNDFRIVFFFMHF